MFMMVAMSWQQIWGAGSESSGSNEDEDSTGEAVLFVPADADKAPEFALTDHPIDVSHVELDDDGWLDASLRQAGIGAVSGVVAITVYQPCFYAGNCAINGNQFEFNPRVWYRGYLVYAGSMVLNTALQMWANAFLTALWFGGKETSDVEKAYVATAAGALSALVGSPTELIVMDRQTSGKLVSQIVRQVWGTGLWRGLTPTMCREGGFTAGYLAGAPWVQKAVSPYCPSDDAAAFVGGAIIGAGVAAATQPFNVVASRMRAQDIAFRMGKGNRTTLRGMVGSLFRQGRIGAFWKGSQARIFGTAGAVGAMNVVNNQFKK